MGGQRGDSQRSTDVERHLRGQSNGLDRRHHDVFLGGAFGALPCNVPQPHAVADLDAVDVLADRVDDSRTILSGDVRGGYDVAIPTASVQIRRIDPRHDDTDTNFPGTDGRNRPIDELKYRIPARVVNDRPH